LAGQEVNQTQTLLCRGPSNSHKKIPCHQNRRTAKKRELYGHVKGQIR